MERVSVRPHDLLRLAPDTPPFADAPAWVAAALERAPFVVVRRAPRIGDDIAVGVRGAVRGERFGAWLAPRWIGRVLSPEDLRSRAPGPARAALPAFALLRAVSPLLDARDLDWGPAGSAGFELATALSTITPSSDLDIVVRAPAPVSRDDAAALFDALSQTARKEGARIDVQVETPGAAFSLAEFARANPRVMLKHADGPRLVDDPWAAP
jgi:phosphoribosyl-dephospho-CoA transferase